MHTGSGGMQGGSARAVQALRSRAAAGGGSWTIWAGAGVAQCATGCGASRRWWASGTAPTAGRRQEAFLAYADWPRERFEVTGAYATWAGRSFCPVCGTRLFHLSDDQAEIALGSLDTAPTGLTPVRELWIRRREPWLATVAGAAQFREDAE